MDRGDDRLPVDGPAQVGLRAPAPCLGGRLLGRPAGEVLLDVGPRAEAAARAVKDRHPGFLVGVELQVRGCQVFLKLVVHRVERPGAVEHDVADLAFALVGHRFVLGHWRYLQCRLSPAPPAPSGASGLTSRPWVPEARGVMLPVSLQQSERNSGLDSGRTTPRCRSIAMLLTRIWSDDRTRRLWTPQRTGHRPYRNIPRRKLAVNLAGKGIDVLRTPVL